MEARIYSDSVDFSAPEREPWMEYASCVGAPPDDFFPHGDAKEEVLALCEGCEVRIQCLAFALVSERSNTGKRYGVWGGKNASERRALQKYLDQVAEAKREAQKVEKEDG